MIDQKTSFELYDDPRFNRAAVKRAVPTIIVVIVFFLFIGFMTNTQGMLALQSHVITAVLYMLCIIFISTLIGYPISQAKSGMKTRYAIEILPEQIVISSKKGKVIEKFLRDEVQTIVLTDYTYMHNHNRITQHLITIAARACKPTFGLMSVSDKHRMSEVLKNFSYSVG